MSDTIEDLERGKYDNCASNTTLSLWQRCDKFVLGDHPLEEKFRALGVVNKIIGEETPTDPVERQKQLDEWMQALKETGVEHE